MISKSYYSAIRLNRFSIYLLLVLLTIGCNDSSEIEPDEEFGDAVALLNGIPWESSEVSIISLQTVPKKFSLNINISNQFGDRRESFNIDGILGKLGRQNVVSTERNDFQEVFTHYSTWAADGDALLDFYLLDTAIVNNYVEINSYNSQDLEISGEFKVALTIALQGSDQRDPSEKIVFTNGRFTAKVEPGWFD